MSELIVRILDIQRFSAVENAQNLSVGKRHLQRIHSCHVLKLPYHRWNIVSQNIQLKQVFINLVIIEMGCYNIGSYIIGRMLYRRKGMNFITDRKYNNSTWMLACGSSDINTSAGNSLHLAPSLH